MMLQVARLAAIFFLCLTAIPAVPATAQDAGPTAMAADAEVSVAAEADAERLHRRLVATKRQRGENAMLREYNDLRKSDRDAVARYARIRRWKVGRLSDAEERSLAEAAQREAASRGEASAQAISGCKGDSVTYVGENAVQQDLVKYSQYTYYCGNGSEISYVTCTPSADANGLWNFDGHQTDCSTNGFFQGGIGFESFAKVSQGSFSVLCFEGNCVQRVNPYVGHLGYANGTMFEAQGEGVISPRWEGPIQPNGFPD